MTRTEKIAVALGMGSQALPSIDSVLDAVARYPDTKDCAREHILSRIKILAVSIVIRLDGEPEAAPSGPTAPSVMPSNAGRGKPIPLPKVAHHLRRRGYIAPTYPQLYMLFCQGFKGAWQGRSKRWFTTSDQLDAIAQRLNLRRRPTLANLSVVPR